MSWNSTSDVWSSTADILSCPDSSGTPLEAAGAAAGAVADAAANATAAAILESATVRCVPAATRAPLTTSAAWARCAGVAFSPSIFQSLRNSVKSVALAFASRLPM